MWQDIVFTLGGFVFALLLLPILLDKNAQVPRITSIPTSITLLIFSFTYLSLGLYLSAITNILTASCWAGISIWRQPPEEDKLRLVDIYEKVR